MVPQGFHSEPGSPQENGYSKSINGRLRDENLNRELSHVEGGADRHRPIRGEIQHEAAALGSTPPAPAIAPGSIKPKLASPSFAHSED